MHDNKLMDQFVELRAQGLSIPKISEKIGVPAPTLYHWHERARDRIHKLRVLMIEEVEEKVLGAHQTQYESLARCLGAIDSQIAAEIADEAVETFTLPQLIRMSASLRRQLHALKVHLALPSEEKPADISPEAPSSSPETQDQK